MIPQRKIAAGPCGRWFDQFAYTIGQAVPPCNMITTRPPRYEIRDARCMLRTIDSPWCLWVEGGILWYLESRILVLMRCGVLLTRPIAKLF